uniref:Ovule protein n=1 Tax=Angiostrongylus cantonensis TaxID=6313 RepID=A0A0K0DJF9_ANGCA
MLNDFEFDLLLNSIGKFDLLGLYHITCCMKLKHCFQLACAANAFICLRLGILLFRAAPNSQILALTTVIIDGDKTSRLVVVSFPGLFS